MVLKFRTSIVGLMYFIIQFFAMNFKVVISLMKTRSPEDHQHHVSFSKEGILFVSGSLSMPD